MFEAIGISRSFGKNRVLHNLSLKLEDNSFNALIGPSGSGKSVLLKILGGVDQPESGSVVSSMGELKENDRSLMFQEGALFDSLSVFDNVAFPLVRGNVPCASLPSDTLEEVHSKVEGILRRVGLTKAAYKMPGQLSGGMRRRVSLARALVNRPRCVFLDDPTCGLDPVASSVIMDLICDLHAEYKPTMVIVSHDLRRLLPVTQRIIALFDGQIVFSGSLAELVSSAPEQVRRFVSCRFDFGGKPLYAS
ncbi:MAG: ATP-binding cassette domain-containing protein [Bdellovibrionales bacterium]|nr:ATP-binding cassette domain-containing protein [Bdellovibrionales bacterium]